jgi:hypothetical protein
VIAKPEPASAIVTWTPPVNDGGAPILSYDVISSLGPRLTVQAPATSAILTNLSPVSQTFTVDATNGLGTGPASTPAAAVTPAAIPAGAPGAPTVTGAQPGIGSALVTWTPPANTGMSAITGYTVFSSEGAQASAGPSATSLVLVGLSSAPHMFMVVATNTQGTGPGGTSSFISPGPGGTFHSLSPARILDTRDGTGGVPAAPLGGGGTLTVQVAGRGGVPASGVSAVVLNATVTNTSASSFLTIWPHGFAKPLVSNLNWVPGLTVPNLVTVALGQGGQLDIFNLAGSTDVIFDVAGWVGDSFNSTGPEGMFNPLSPVRLLDTRSGGGPVGPGQTINLQVTGRGGVPASGVSAVVLNVTVTNPTASSFLTVWPAGTSQPLASNLNFVAGQTVPNRVFVKVGAGGQVSIFNLGGTSDVVVDVNGWFTDATNTSGGSGLAAVVPFRFFDTRNGFGPIPGGSFLQLGVAPGVLSGLILNVTATNPTASSFLTLWPDDATRPLASDLNFVAGQTVPNLTVVKVGADGGFNTFNFLGSVDVVFDIDAFFGLPVRPLTASNKVGMAHAMPDSGMREPALQGLGGPDLSVHAVSLRTSLATRQG